MSFLFQGNPYPTVSSTSTSTNAPPSWLQSWINQGLQKADSALDEPYQDYTGPRNAPLTADQQSAYDLTRNNAGMFTPMLNQAGANLTAGGTAVNNDDINNYLNPYTNDVVNNIATLANRNLTENVLPGVNATFLQAGQGIGSSRNSDFTLRALRDNQDTISQQQGNALAAGFNTSLSAAQQQKTNLLNSGQQLGSLASTGQNINLKDAAALQSIGQEQQGETQKSYDTAYQDFLTQKGYPLQQATTALQLIEGLPTSTTQGTQTTTSTSPGQAGNFQPSSLAQITGVGAGLAGLLGSSGFAKGGPVPSRPSLRAGGKKRGRPKAVSNSEAHFMPMVNSVHDQPMPSLAAVPSMAPRKGPKSAMLSATPRPNLTSLRAA